MVAEESKTSSSRRKKGRLDAVGGERPKGRKNAKKRRPLDKTSMRDLALSYVARFSTTGAKLEAYLARKLRERGTGEDAEGRTIDLDVQGLVAEFVERGYVDDDAYARSKSRDLTARGYGARRVEQALWAAGVEENLRNEHVPGEMESRNAAALMARKRRFGPYGAPLEEDADRSELHKKREKQVAAMLRAGHRYEHATFILDAAAIEEIEEWLAVAEAEEADRETDTW